MEARESCMLSEDLAELLGKIRHDLCAVWPESLTYSGPAENGGSIRTCRDGGEYGKMVLAACLKAAGAVGAVGLGLG